jgi:hypothetical protein
VFFFQRLPVVAQVNVLDSCTPSPTGSSPLRTVAPFCHSDTLLLPMNSEGNSEGHGRTRTSKSSTHTFPATHPLVHHIHHADSGTGQGGSLQHQQRFTIRTVLSSDEEEPLRRGSLSPCSSLVGWHADCSSHISSTRCVIFLSLSLCWMSRTLH